jgi:cell division protein FtsZ
MKCKFNRRFFLKTISALGLGIFAEGALVGNWKRLSISSIKVVGVGGAGANIINLLGKTCESENVDMVVVDSDHECLKISSALTNIIVHRESGKLDLGDRDSEFSTLQKIMQTVKGGKSVCLIAGLGGETGTVLAPTIAGICKAIGRKPMSLVFMPGSREGRMKMEKAIRSLHVLRKLSDPVYVIPTDLAKRLAKQDGDTFSKAAEMAVMYLKSHLNHHLKERIA